MDLLNFTILDVITIEAECKEWDLHNAFSFDVITYQVADRSVTLTWKLSGFGVPPPDTQGFCITFSDVDYFEASPRDPEIPDYSEDLCLSMMSQVPTELGYSRLQFEFRGGQVVTIGARSAAFSPFLSES